VIDKLELRVPARLHGQPVYLAPEVGQISRETRGTPQDPFRHSRHYTSVADLRPFGISAILHSSCLHGEGNHKVELVDTGRMTYTAMLAEVERVFDINPRRLELMRIDLAADIEGVAVPWFHEHMRVKWKRWGCEYGRVEVSRMGHTELQTLYFGRRPNCLRVYNKVAEWQKDYAARRRAAERDGTPLQPFEETYGWPAQGRVLTRVERQMAGGRVPAEIGTLGAAPQALPSFQPFEAVDLLASAGEATPPPPEGGEGIEHWLAGMQLRDLVNEWGIQRTRAFLNRHGHRNGGRILDKFGAFLPAGDGINAARLQEIYQSSVERQLAA
jgi:hypothetical protein